MKNLSQGLKDHLAGDMLTLATCWRISRTDGKVQGFTDHDQDLFFGGLLYRASSGFRRTAFTADSTLAVRNVTVEGVISSSQISEAELVGGRYDNAVVDVFIVNWQSLPTSIYAEPFDCIILLKGRFGEATNLSGDSFQIELRSLSEPLQAATTIQTQPLCRATFGSSRCGVNLQPLTYTFTVAEAFSTWRFSATPAKPVDSMANNGVITFTTGNNAGIFRQCKAYDGFTFELHDPFPFPIQAGDTFIGSQGCSKQLTGAFSCAHYNNTINFQGEPYLPGQDEFLAGFTG